MKARFSLFTKIILWFLLSFALISGVAIIVFAIQVRNDPESAFRGKSVKRLHASVMLIAQELEATEKENWDSVLAKWSEAYNSQFLLYLRNGEKLAGFKTPPLPPDVAHMLSQRGKFLVKTSIPPRSWLGLPFPGVIGTDGKIHVRGFGRGMGAGPGPEMGLGKGFGMGRGGGNRPILVIVSDPNKGDGIFSDATPFLIVGIIIIGLSVLIWLPLVKNLTRPIGEMTHAAEMISQGRFDSRVDDKRSDEIGRLGKSINNMAAKLSHLVDGQKRFLGDVSHELRSPLARIQIAMELLEQSATDKQAEYIKGGLEDVEQMSKLVGELLSVAKAEVNPDQVSLETVTLAPVVFDVADREGKGLENIKIDIDENISVLADPDLLSRALSNLVRNSVRYARDAGPIEINAWLEKDKVYIQVKDSGPGVPPDSIDQLFDPFFRPEIDRDRDTGGAGLGLAIVKTCIDACNGTVSAANLTEGGFAVTMVLKGQSPSL